MKKHNKLQAFTLVELIVVIVILAILATIAFLSFNNYNSSARDSTRLSDISNIAKGLTIQYSIGGYYIIPDNSVNLYSGATQIGYQGKAGTNVLNSIKISSNSGKDPLNNTYYTYNINYNKSKYQVTGYLESRGGVVNRVGYEDNNSVENGKYKIENSILPVILNSFQDPSILTHYGYGTKFSMTTNKNFVITRNEAIHNNFNFINQTYSTNYTNRYPYTRGDSIGVILSSTGGTGSIIYTPLEDMTTSTGIDVSSGTLTSGKIVISNNTDSSTGVSVGSMSGYVSDGSSNSSNIPPVDPNFINAVGGVVTYDGDYKIHTFTTNGTFVINSLGINPTYGDKVEYLVVAGGGGGAGGGYLYNTYAGGGGGGAGGFRTGTNFVVTMNSFPIIVGAGGIEGTPSVSSSAPYGTSGNDGNNSVFSSIISIGGGGGGAIQGRSGGSGGGGASAGQPGGTGQSGQGNNGGGGQGYYGGGGGGGGGATSAGVTAAGNVGSAGGLGTSSAISGISLCYAGGGGGGSGPRGGGFGSASCGGGAGSDSATAGTSGIPNTGGGGGGGAVGSYGGSGASGIVIIKYKYK